jgi:flavin-dependent dehydrogenase
MTSTDVFVIGGGPAGLAAAIAARRKGFDVTLADPAAPAHDKACGEGLMPDAIEAAAAIGIDLSRVESHPFRGIRFHFAGRAVAAPFPHAIGLGVRRTALHETLAEQAAQSGVRMLWGCRVEGIADGSVVLGTGPVRARFIIGADGGRSRVRAWSGLDRTRRDTRRFGIRRRFATEPWSAFMEVHWSQHAQIYLTPVSDREVCAALISRDSRLRFDEALSLFPQAAARLRGAPASGRDQGGVTASRCLRRVTAGGVALVGDASGSVDAITGQGICLALQQAAALADAMAHDNLARYQDAHDRLMRRPRFMSNLMLTLDGRAWMQRAALGAMSLWPRSFEALLAFHVSG